jgi:stage II sporulation protein M
MDVTVILNHYRQIWRDLKEVKWHIFAAIAIFVAGIIVPLIIPSIGKGVISEFLGYFKTFPHKTTLALLVAIFLKNALSALVAILLGFLLGIVPVFGAVFNGIAVGAVVNMNPLYAFMLIPHGIFELSAIFIAWGMGIWCAGGLFHPPAVSIRVKRSLNIYLSVIVPLLVIAAIIEVYSAKILFGMK